MEFRIIIIQRKENGFWNTAFIFLTTYQCFRIVTMPKYFFCIEVIMLLLAKCLDGLEDSLTGIIEVTIFTKAAKWPKMPSCRLILTVNHYCAITTIILQQTTVCSTKLTY